MKTMTLKALLNVAVDSKYRITMKHLGEEYETITIDYLGNNDDFGKALKRRNEFLKMKHEVKWITCNSVANCLDITLYELPTV